MQVIGTGRKVFCVAFVIFVFFLAGCQQKQYTPSEEDMATEIEKRLLKAEKGSFIVFKEKGIIKIIFSPNLKKAGSYGVPTVMVDGYPSGHPYDRMSVESFRYKLSKVIYPYDPEYEKYAKKFALQQVGIYEYRD